MRYIIYFLLLVHPIIVNSQTENLNQFWNEYAFTKPLSQNWVVELDAGFTSSSTPDDKNLFSDLTQAYFRGWAHYYPGDRWKISVFYAYYSNKNVPELNQTEAPEWRSALQLSYSLVKDHRIKVNLRFRFEDRHLHNDDGYFEAAERLRFQVKSVCPINDVRIHKGVLYSFAAEEVFFKTDSQVSGPENFDRNRLTLGLGYEFVKDLLVEVSYNNEIMPRQDVDKFVNAVQVKVIFNNFLPDLIKSFERTKKAVDEGNGGL
ncbi:DUF2490 domain-containing protein [Flavobacterium sp. ov086]|uniref:DUF2490 domain-containing protein n=1 Tax=Flavobacterium sp. ov086 TaxID=1761785 RepID=UPI000B65C545|nr:DUF2490 domain-containing protein [Flavobacterium sp. ov086]SNR44271.1 Protein of unknown function [Flavobacterium sp. ov086]